MNATKLHLFVWAEFAPDYTDGLAFAIAPTVEEAQKLVTARLGYEPYIWGPVQVFPADEPIAFAVYGGS